MMAPSVFASATVADVMRLAGLAVPSNPKKLTRCPLHADDTASFRIFPRGWICFGCRRKGGVSDLIIALGKASSRAEAARWLEARLA